MDNSIAHAQFVYVGVENLVHKAYAWALVGILIWKLNMNAPHPALKWC